jgi:ABC-2 type transport system permease protein
VAVWGTVIGSLADSVARTLAGSGFASTVSPVLGGSLTAIAYVSFAVFQLLGVALGLVVAAQLAAARDEEVAGRLELLLAGAVGRARWLAGRIVVTLTVAGAIAATASLAAWLAMTNRGIDIALSRQFGAGANALPAAVLKLGIGVAFFGVQPRFAASAVYAVVATGFLLELVGTLVNAPGWMLDLSPFHHVALAPFQSVNAGAALAMCGLGLALCGAGIVAFTRRDLQPA